MFKRDDDIPLCKNKLNEDSFIIKITNHVLLKSIFSLKGDFRLGLQPEMICQKGIFLAPFKNNAQAAACISADFELNWAWRELEPGKRDQKSLRARSNVPIILDILDNYQIPITWATVGHLFLTECNRGENGLAHPEMPRPLKNNPWSGDWYSHDPCTNLTNHPLWYCPDLIRQILKAQVRHEIGTHSFSHIDFSPEYSNSQLVKEEIEASKKAMAPYGVKPRSLIYPFNKMGHHHGDLLSDLGITVVRHRDDRIRLSYPQRMDCGVYRLYESMNLRYSKQYHYPEKTIIYLRQAMKEQALYHLWFHPSDKTVVFKTVFREIVENMDRERQKGHLWIASMGAVAAFCEARRATSFQVMQENDHIHIEINSRYDQERFGQTKLSFIIPSIPMPISGTLVTKNKITPLPTESIILNPNGSGIVVNVDVGTDAITLQV